MAPKASKNGGKPLPRLTVEQIKDAPDLTEATVDVPEWKGSVVIRGVSKAVWERYTELEPPDDIQYLLSQAIIDPVFSTEDVAMLREKSVIAVGRVEQAVLKASGLGGFVEEAEARFLAGDS